VVVEEVLVEMEVVVGRADIAAHLEAAVARMAGGEFALS
jgi:hypothetical protein